jgi:hypothetical protein
VPADSAPAPTRAVSPKSAVKIDNEGLPDIGLKSTHDYIKHLGTGGTGDVYLYREKSSGQLVAAKLIKRPLPRVIMPNILREVLVRDGYWPV